MKQDEETGSTYLLAIIFNSWSREVLNGFALEQDLKRKSSVNIHSGMIGQISRGGIQRGAAHIPCC